MSSGIIIDNKNENIDIEWSIHFNIVFYEYKTYFLPNQKFSLSTLLCTHAQERKYWRTHGRFVYLHVHILAKHLRKRRWWDKSRAGSGSPSSHHYCSATWVCRRKREQNFVWWKCLAPQKFGDEIIFSQIAATVLHGSCLRP